MEEIIHVCIEEWKQLVIDGVPWDYHISNSGKVYSRKRCRLLKFTNDRGWQKIRLTGPNGTHKQFAVHRLVGFMFVPGYEEGLTINHMSGVKDNNWFWNLEWVTQAENERHAVINGLKAHGERHFGNIHTEKSIHEVCKLLEQLIPYEEIVKRTGVDLTVVYDVKNRKSWKFVSDQYNIISSEQNLTKYSRYLKAIHNLFEMGLKTKDIMKELGIPYKDKTFRSFMNRARGKYNLSA